MSNKVRDRKCDRISLFWSDPKDAVLREQLVEIVESGLSEAVLRSDCKIPENTKVRLAGNEYRGDWTVRSCRKEGRQFQLTVCVGEKLPPGNGKAAFDPGIFAVEGFLTEEQEAEVLKNLEDDEGPAGLNFVSISFKFARRRFARGLQSRLAETR